MAPSPPPALGIRLGRLTGQTLVTCWLAQGLWAAMVSLWLPIPVRPLLIDRSACDGAQWHHLLRRYADLHLQDQLGQQRFSPVIEVSVLGERLTPRLPPPRRLARVALVGVRAGPRLAALRDRYPSALLLACPAAAGP
jgi:hypothetical protein